jgi:hypothetical protein
MRLLNAMGKGILVTGMCINISSMRQIIITLSTYPIVALNRNVFYFEFHHAGRYRHFGYVANGFSQQAFADG